MWWSLEEPSTSTDPRCLWSLILHLLRKWQPLQMSFSSSTPRHKAGPVPRCTKSCVNSDPMDGVRQPNIISYFWGQDFLGYKPQLWKALIFFHWTLRTGSHFHGFFRPFCCSPLKVFTPALLCRPNYLHRELDVSHPSIPNTAQTQQRSNKHFPLVHFKQRCSHHGRKPLVNWTHRAKHLMLKKKELIKKLKLKTRSVFILLAPFNRADSPHRYKQLAEIKQSCWPLSSNYQNTESDLKTQQQLLKVGQVSQSAHQDSDQKL